MSFVTCPVEGRVFAHLLGVLRLYEWVSAILVISSVIVLRFQILLFMNVAAVSVIFYQQTDNLFVAVAGRPEQRIPSVLFCVRISLFQK